MQAEQIDIDRVINYAAEYGAVVRKAKPSGGDNMIGLCPLPGHTDKDPSFSYNTRTGMFHCFACGKEGNFIKFYSELHGVDTKQAYKDILEKYDLIEDPEERKKKQNKPPKGTLENFTISEYCFQKKLPEDWLKEHCGVQNAKETWGSKTAYLKIPYFKEESNDELIFRKRYAHKEFRWCKGAAGKIPLYGEWKLPEIRQIGYTTLVEGESDTQSLWYMNISTLGVAGASLFRIEQAELLQDLKLYLHIEPDRGGETFLAQMTRKLRDGKFIGEVYTWSCKQFGVKDPSELYIKYGKDDAAKKVMQAIKEAKKLDLEDLNDIIPEVVKGAPVNLRQPEGWVYSEKGISHIEQKTQMLSMVCRTPIILTQRLRSMETGEEKIEVAFKRDDEWHTAIFPRSVIFTSRGITTLADLGCTVTSENAKMVVSFLSALEAENIDIITKADATGTFGWQPGKKFIPGHGENIVLDIDSSQRAQANAYCMQGTFEAWKETMREHRNRDKFRFILAASFAAPLLRILRQRIFFVYNWGGSKGGKTAALKAALSAWGDPERLMVNFNATQVGLERTASFYCDLPLGIDERQLAGNNQGSLEKIVYMIASGTGKIRGAKSGGIQATNTWRTIALATGEEPLSTETTQTGVSTRVLEIYGGPFENEKDASLMHQNAPMNCGWAGPYFVGKIIGMNEDIIRDYYEKMTEYVFSISEGKSGSHVSGVAAVALADAMVDTWIFKGKEEIDDESWNKAKRMALSILKEQMDSETGDVNENAVQFVVDWILSNKDNFGDKTFGTCLGTVRDDNTVYLFPTILNQALTKAGYSPRKTMKYMADNGIIYSTTKSDGKKIYTTTKWFNGRVCRFVQFNMELFAKNSDPLKNEDEIARDMNPKVDGDGFQQVDMEDLPFKNKEDALPY